jgi:trehalose synthase
MLAAAGREARQVSGTGAQWRHRYGLPQPREAVRAAPVWLLDYPGSVVPRPGHSVVATWADPALWEALQDLGITLLHTGPVKRAGGVRGREFTPSTDGWFDPIALDVDPALGTDDEYRALVRVAAQHQALVAGDLVPLHTGTGPDFRLAQMAYRDYPGMYTMVEIGRDDWGLLPPVEDRWGAAPIPRDAAARLTEKGYLPGLVHSNDAAKGAGNLSGWSATGEVTGADGRARRWAYLHYFKPGQPTLNWLDPSFAGPRAVAGDVVKTVHGLGARVVRLDAVPFLGIEPQPGKAESQHYLTPLSVTATDELALLIRKMGGWSFHELNVPLVELKKYTAHGPDLSYDFFTRAQVLHALLVGDARYLRQAYGFLSGAGIDVGSLVHDLQNHDEITYQLVELEHRKGEALAFGAEKATGGELRERMLREMRARAAGDAAPYNRLYRPEQDGVATTFAGFVAASLGVRDPYHATAEERERIKRGHLLLAFANAMQPGAFSLSSWDLVGALPVPEEAVKGQLGDDDYRWINRGGVDLMGAAPAARESACGLPKARALYGPLPEQLRDPDSFASRLKRILAARKEYGIAEGELLAVPEVKGPGACLLVVRLPGEGRVAVTALNFGREAADEELDLTGVPGLSAEGLRGAGIAEAVGGGDGGAVSPEGRLKIRVPALAGTTLVITPRRR